MRMRGAFWAALVVGTAVAAPATPQVGPRQGVVARGWLGVTIADVTPQIASEAGLGAVRGAAVVGVAERSPAEKAGLQAGDIVLEADGQPIRDQRTFGQIVQLKSPGELIRLRVWRKGRTLDVEARLVQRPPDQAVSQVTDEARQARFAQCRQLVCPVCDDPANPMAGLSDACFGCIQKSSQQIEECINGAAPSAPGGGAGQPAGEPGPPPPALAVNRVEVKPARVAPGERFTVTVSYTAAAGGVPVFSYAIRSGGRALLESKPQQLDAGSGEPMYITKTLAAAKTPGAYTVRVTLALGDVRIEREAELTVAPR